jgi:fatty-acid desaturase
VSVESPLTDEVEGVSLLANARVAEPSVDENGTERNRRKAIAHPIPTRLRDRFPNGMNWTNFTWMLVMHSGAVASLWYFSWTGLAICAVLHFVTACLGVTLGYHRLLTHGSFKVPKPVEYFFSVCGMLSAEGSPIFWV